jgi:hypothetical protein
MLARLGRQVQAWARKSHHQRGCKGVLLSRSLCRVTPTGMLAMPYEALCPQPWGQRVGGVSGRPTRATRRSDPPTYPSRNGERHPDLRDASSLRGPLEERKSWSVRLVCRGLVPRQTTAPMTAGVLWKKEEGNVVSVRQAHALFEGAPNKRLHRTRTRPSLGPETRARQSPLTLNSSRRVKARSRGWRGGQSIAVGQTHESGTITGTGALVDGRSAARRSSPLLGATRAGRA